MAARIESSRSGNNACSVCLELFTEPKVLPCCHTFCLQCLKKSVQKQGEITCPQCRKTHRIPKGGLGALLTDFIEAYKAEVAGLKASNSHRREKTQICGECEQTGPVGFYCRDCQTYLCAECGLQLHKRLKAYRGHKVIPIDHIDATILPSSHIHYCAVHKNEALKLYCKTCSKLICRDCTLVEHRQHNYIFVQEARELVKAEMTSLRAEVEQKFGQFKSNLKEINNVEVSVNGHSEVVKADINAFFDKLVRCIEERRKLLLRQAEADCQKDLKQIWTDKSFHEIAITQISSVFGLADKAQKCTSDTEMVLTALHSITQLKKLRETEWESIAFTTTVSSTPQFSEGEQIEIDSLGGVVRDTSSLCDIHVKPLNHRQWRQLRASLDTLQARLGSSLSLQVDVTVPLAKTLVNKRSGKAVD